MPVHPDVSIGESPDNVPVITGVATSIAAFVGYTARGVDHQPERVASFSDFERMFGGLAADSELSYAVSHYFQNGERRPSSPACPGATPRRR